MPNMMGVKAFRIGEPLDRNRCSDTNGGCSHLCFNRPDDYTCGCPLGKISTDRAYRLTNSFNFQPTLRTINVPDEIVSENCICDSVQISHIQFPAAKFQELGPGCKGIPNVRINLLCSASPNRKFENLLGKTNDVILMS